MANMYIEIYGFMIGRLVGEAKLMDSFAMSEKLKLFSSLCHEKIMNLVTGRSLHLKISTALYDRYDLRCMDTVISPLFIMSCCVLFSYHICVHVHASYAMIHITNTNTRFLFSCVSCMLWAILSIWPVNAGYHTLVFVAKSKDLGNEKGSEERRRASTQRFHLLTSVRSEVGYNSMPFTIKLDWLMYHLDKSMYGSC